MRFAATAAVLVSLAAWPTAAWSGSGRVEGRAIRNLVYQTDPCLARIIDKENPPWVVTLYNGFTRWHPGEAMKRRSYGLPQSLPPEKMATAGADWRTNWQTQLRWMRGYASDRYGSSCGALAFWNRHGYY